MGNKEKTPPDPDNDTVVGAVHVFGDETTLHGLRYMIGRNHIVTRICWLVIVGLAFALLVTQAKTVYEDFQSSPYSTKIDISWEVVRPLPAVTVCNDNRLRRSKLYDTKYEGLISIDDGNDEESIDIRYSELSDSSDAWEAVTDEYDWVGFYAAAKTDGDFSDFVSVVNPTRAELIDYGHTLEDFMVECTFNQKSCNFSTDFTVLQNRHYGNCFTYNFGNEAKPPLMTTKTGAQSGLQLSLMVEEDEYMGLLAPNRGAKVVIHAPNTVPFPEDDGIDLATGSAISIGIREEVIQRLPAFSNCVEDQEIGINFSNFTTNYTVRCCLNICYQHHLIDRCGCVDDIILDHKLCSIVNKTQVDCVDEVQELYINDTLGCDCPLPCTETNYRTSISSAAWPSRRFKKHLVEKFIHHQKLRYILNDDETSRNNMIRVMIYFETLNVERVEQMPRYTIPNILGNLGGLMGLFTGMSFVSIFEIVYLLLRVTKITFSKLFLADRVQSIKA